MTTPPNGQPSGPASCTTCRSVLRTCPKCSRATCHQAHGPECAGVVMSRHVLVTPLPRRVRARLAFHRKVDAVCTWLLFHDRERPALFIWRTFGMMR